MDDNRPGPSSRAVRRRRDLTAGEAADLHARMSRLESKSAGFEQAIVIRFDEVNQDLNRFEANSETQKKFISQEIARIEELTHTAVQHSQSQIDSLRQQTSDIHASLTDMHDHSTLLTEGLRSMMESFRDMRFDLPNTFEGWMRTREGRGNGTVSGPELQPWTSGRSTPFPTLPTPPPLHVSPGRPDPNPAALGFTAGESAAAATESPHQSANPYVASAPNSPNDPFQQYIDPHMGEVSEPLMDLEQTFMVSEEAGEEKAAVEEMQRDGLDAPEDIEMPPVETEQEGQVGEDVGEAGRTDGQVEQEEEKGHPESLEEGEVAEEVESSPPGVAAAEDAAPQRLSLSQRTPPSTPPTVIREISVAPPSGLLVSSSLEVCPPTSQITSPTAPSSPNLDHRLLNAALTDSAQPPPSAGATDFAGPRTRSRSASITNPPLVSARPRPISKRQGTKNGGESSRK